MKSIKALADLTSVVDSDMISTQSFRRTGCQMYYSLKYSVEAIRVFGRWAPDTIYEYLQDVPLDRFYESFVKLGMYVSFVSCLRW